MPHTPETRARAYQKVRRTRSEWIEVNGPCAECGSRDRLEVDHVDPRQKVSHSIWSWEPVKRAAELSKCRVLCRVCHKRKTALYQSEAFTGRSVPSIRKLSDRDVLKAVLMRQSGMTVREIAPKFGVSHPTIATLTRAAMDGKEFRSRGVLLGTPLRAA